MTLIVMKDSKSVFLNAMRNLKIVILMTVRVATLETKMFFMLYRQILSYQP